jgi:hypothetical protein
MNNKWLIDKLGTDAGLLNYIEHETPRHYFMSSWAVEDDVYTFARMIVDECLKQCYDRGMDDELYEGQLKAAAYIEEHFGIKK